jgi:hypothetical protein
MILSNISMACGSGISAPSAPVWSVNAVLTPLPQMIVPLSRHGNLSRRPMTIQAAFHFAQATHAATIGCGQRTGHTRVTVQWRDLMKCERRGSWV